MAQNSSTTSPKKKGAVSYNKWGYIFLIPFFVTYIIFNLVPLFSTIYYSFFKYYREGLNWIGPEFIGFDNYVKLFSDSRIFDYGINTLIMWVIGFVPQILVSLLLASWFSDTRFKLKGARFFKTVIYLPNLIMAAAFAMLFYSLFNAKGAITQLVQSWGWVDSNFDFFKPVWSARILVGLMNFLMWFGNTTILLMAGIMGIDVSLYEAAEVDGANSKQRFWQITMPLLKPIFVYVFVTSLIGGIQMFDVPAILTQYKGTPFAGGKFTTMTLIMYLRQTLTSRDYGTSGALSVILFFITAVLSLLVYRVMYSKKSREA
ncbi:MAG: sugar ABC transporter permease [Lachnospiraceae bacterium]|nr:sugar ABC transporter permease [Lachnospiraceae bacterium]